MLTGWLDWQRNTVRLKCQGLSEDQVRRAPLPASPRMTIATVVAHLCWVELAWFEVSFLGACHLATQDPLELPTPPATPLAVLLDEYDAQCVRSREIVAARDLDEIEAWAPAGLELVSLRWIVNHLLEETARHLGHLDTLRELTHDTTNY
ncbi:DinB family protein [Kribbella sp. CA-293567]|uniref:DinB family protein n=1 Tax=Kribbella sp. CA-293567 TaxID=3002436 RepID=UPI0022DE3F8C|nr:DinB family protein [Kribbella sp. CA-293567]WBQ08630.1 DinB family protein [Kribbella sp. CA-293567]